MSATAVIRWRGRATVWSWGSPSWPPSTGTRKWSRTAIEAHREAPEEIVLDLDADDPLHGHQEGRFFHGYYRCYCYLPLYITCGEHVLCCRLRPSNIDASYGSVQDAAHRRAGARMLAGYALRGDSGFCREELMAWCPTLVQAQTSRLRELRARRTSGVVLAIPLHKGAARYYAEKGLLLAIPDAAKPVD